MNKNFMQKALVKIPHRSGFDKSFQSLFTMPVGTLIPLMCDEIPANTKVNLKAIVSASLPPLVSDTFLRTDIALEAFFVPLRQLYGGFEHWLTGEQLENGSGVLSDVATPYIAISGKTSVGDYFSPSSLGDYLGGKATNTDINAVTTNDGMEFSPYPFVAYHWIWDNWYRNKAITKSCFMRPTMGVSNVAQAKYLPYVSFTGSGNIKNIIDTLADNTHLYELRQRNYGLDYFTAATTSPQSGQAEGISIDTSGSTGSFTISALRLANSLQQFKERNNFASLDYGDWLKVNYGANLRSGTAQKPLYLGSGRIPVYSKGIYQNSNDESTTLSDNGNPFAQGVGARYGSAYGDGNVPLIDGFVSEEPGYIFVMISLVPKPTYSTGFAPMLRRYIHNGSQVEMALPALQNVGPQPIMKSELNFRSILADSSGSKDGVFGYIDRFAEFMTREDEIHGQYRQYGSLETFAHQRVFSIAPVNAPTINSSFISIDASVLNPLYVYPDNIDLSEGLVMVDSFLDYKVSMPLQQFSIPSLENVDGESLIVERAGTAIKG